MRNYITMILLILLASCSVNIADISKDKMEYIRSAIVCDCKSTFYVITNPDELVDFLDGDSDAVEIKYKYKKSKDVSLKRSIKMARGINKSGVEYYRTEFERYSFPMSDCRKLKTKPKYFK